MVDRADAIRIETIHRKNGGPRKTFVLLCSQEGCGQEIRVRCNALSTHSGRCSTHSHIKRPFESLYNGLFTDHRQLVVTLTYEEFVSFTKVNACHYCATGIDWVPYSTVRGEYQSRAYYLDRKDTLLGYSKENCVVCCTACNKLRGNLFTYEEFLMLAPVLQRIRQQRVDNSHKQW